jgi:NTP pyrophosphatase (non-canonical NTP hydrolase)
VKLKHTYNPAKSSPFSDYYDTEFLMNMDEYQEAAHLLALPSALSNDYLVPGLAGETGEVCSLFAKMARDGANPHEFDEKVAKELGDVLWFIAVLAKQQGLTLGMIAYENLQKLYSRAQRGVLGGSGDDR